MNGYGWYPPSVAARCPWLPSADWQSPCSHHTKEPSMFLPCLWNKTKNSLHQDRSLSAQSYLTTLPALTVPHGASCVIAPAHRGNAYLERVTVKSLSPNTHTKIRISRSQKSIKPDARLNVLAQSTPGPSPVAPS